MLFRELQLNKNFLKLGLALLIVVTFFLILPSRAEAKSSAQYCISGYNYLDWSGGGEAAGGKICCPNGSVADASNYLCRSQTTNALVESFEPKANNFTSGPEICPDKTLLVYSAGKANYCLNQGEIVKAALDGIGEGKVFAGCRPGLPVFTTTKHNADGTTRIYNLPTFCTGNGGFFIEDTNICLCKDETAFPLEESTPECSTLCSNRGGVIFDGKEFGISPNICSGANCCNGDPKCEACVGSEQGSETGRIYTSLGCIDPTREGIVVWLIRISLILTTVIGVFRFIQASLLIRSGDPEKIKEGQEIVTSAIIALVLVLLSVPLLQFIGVNVLGVFPEGFV